MNVAARMIAWCHAHDVPSFLVFQLVALIAAGWVFARRLPRDRARRLRLVAALALGAPVGAVLFGLLLRMPRFVMTHGADALVGSGWLSSYGALGGAVLAVMLVARRMEADGKAEHTPLDALAPALGLLVAVGRLGCFFAGCDFGSRTDLPWAIEVPPSMPAFAEHVRLGLLAPSAVASLGVHPTQLYEALLGLVAATLAEVGLRKRTPRGAPFVVAVTVYALGRFGVEMLRGDLRPSAGSLSVAQWLSLVVLALAAAALARTYETSA